jgi:copper chaperone CopZ
MKAYYFKITTPMVCSGCTSTIERAVSNVKGVQAINVSLTSQTAHVDMIDASANCNCAKTKGDDDDDDDTVGTSCPCGDDCQCTARALMSAMTAVGFDCEVTTAEEHQASSAGGNNGTGKYNTTTTTAEDIYCLCS